MKFVLMILMLVQGVAFGIKFSTDEAQAFLRAKKEKKPLMIDFFGVWCPPCNQFEEQVFNHPRFSVKAKQFVLLKLDADAKTSQAIKAKYKVGGYPTIIFADSEGAEVHRVVGFLELDPFLKMMDMALAARGGDAKAACESNATEALWRCAFVCSERKETECAQKAFKKLEGRLPVGSSKYVIARNYAVENAATPEEKRYGYQKLLEEMPKSSYALYWALQYLQLFSNHNDPALKQDLVERAVGSFSDMLKDPNAADFGMTRTDLAQLRAEVLEKMGKTEMAKSAWKEASLWLEQDSHKLPRGAKGRGYAIERIGCLEAAGDSAAALKLANSYREKFPEEFTFHFWAASILDRNKKYAEALPIAKKAYGYSYGDNRIRVATLLVNLYGTLADKDSAKKVFEEVSHEFQGTETADVRTPKYLKKLEEAWRRVEMTKG